MWEIHYRKFPKPLPFICMCVVLRMEKFIQGSHCIHEEEKHAIFSNKKMEAIFLLSKTHHFEYEEMS